jgi:hypothetical protein
LSNKQARSFSSQVVDEEALAEVDSVEVAASAEVASAEEALVAVAPHQVGK